MSIYEQLKKRRVFPWLGAYAAGGFIALEGVAQLEGYGILPVLAYRIALIVYLFGIPGTAIFAWYHGEVGPQKPTKLEAWLQAGMAIVALAMIGVVTKSYLDEQNLIELASLSGLDESGVAVLYFEDYSPDAELGFVADGLTEALIGRLSQVRSLDVISTNGVAPFRGADVRADSVARVLGVAHIIQGSVEPRGDRLHVTTRLVDGLSGADIDRATFEIPQGEFLAAQDSLAENISRLLREQMGEEIRLREGRAGTRNADVWSLVQRAERLRKDSEELERSDDIDGALRLLVEADSLLTMAEVADPAWTEPSVLRANTSWVRGFILDINLRDPDAAEEEMRRGVEHANRALSISSTDARALEMRGTLKYQLWFVVEDMQEADRLLEEAQADLEAAVDSDPTLASAWSLLAHLYGNQEDNTSVILAARRAFEEDAFLRRADLIVYRLFDAHFGLAQFNDAREWCETGQRRFPEDYRFVQCQLWLMIPPSETADADSAWTLHAAMVDLVPETRRPFESRIGLHLVAGAVWRSGMPDSANTVFEMGRGDPELDPNEELVGAEAQVRAAIGDLDGAMTLLKRYVASNPGHSFTEGGQLFWMWRGLQDRPDFRMLMGGN
jgi:serine/threonine-protein kinase